MTGDEEGKSGRCSGSAGDFGPTREFAGGQPTAVGKDERAPGGLSPVRFVSRSDGGSRAVRKADVDWQAGEMGGVGLAIDVDARHADDAGSRSDETWNEAGRVWGGCERTAAIGGAIFDGAAGFFVDAASVLWSDERKGLDEVGMAAHGSSFEAVRRLENGKGKMEIGALLNSALAR